MLKYNIQNHSCTHFKQSNKQRNADAIKVKQCQFLFTIIKMKQIQCEYRIDATSEGSDGRF